MYDFFTDHPEYMRFSSLSALNVTDKQDPSLVTDLTRLHEVFSYHGFEATGMYLKALHFMCDAFLEKELSPYDRLYKVWWCKTFFTTWQEHVTSPSEFMSKSAYKDITCGCDGLVLYLEMLRRNYPDAEVATYLLGSDQNEQLFAFVRVSYSSGRSRNLDAVKMAQGIERRNVRTELSLPLDSSVIAHTRGRTVLRSTVKIVRPSTISDKVTSSLTRSGTRTWRGSDLDLSKMIQTMNAATRDCIKEGKKRKFGVFLKEEDPERRRGKKINEPGDEDEDDDEDEYDDDDDDDDEGGEMLQFEDEDEGDMVETKLYGKLHYQAAETLLLNGGRSSISAKSRQARFTGDVFGMKTDIRFFNHPFCGCPEAVQKGDLKHLTSFSDKKVIYGEVRFLSYRQCPIKFYCRNHSLVNGSPDVWVFEKRTRKYKRCCL